MKLLKCFILIFTLFLIKDSYATEVPKLELMLNRYDSDIKKQQELLEKLEFLQYDVALSKDLQKNIAGFLIYIQKVGVYADVRNHNDEINLYLLAFQEAYLQGDIKRAREILNKKLNGISYFKWLKLDKNEIDGEGSIGVVNHLHKFDFYKTEDLEVFESDDNYGDETYKRIGCLISIIDDVMGWTPLMWAAALGKKKIVELIFDKSKVKTFHGYNDPSCNFEDQKGYTAYDLALLFGHNEIAKLIFESEYHQDFVKASGISEEEVEVLNCPIQ